MLVHFIDLRFDGADVVISYKGKILTRAVLLHLSKVNLIIKIVFILFSIITLIVSVSLANFFGNNLYLLILILTLFLFLFPFIFRIRFRVGKITTSLNDKKFIENQKNILTKLSKFAFGLLKDVDISSFYIKRKNFYIVNEFYAILMSSDFFRIEKLNSKIVFSFTNFQLKLSGTDVDPTDKIISKSWLYSNKDGSRDKRRKYNLEIFNVSRVNVNINLFGIDKLIYIIGENGKNKFLLSLYENSLNEFMKNYLTEKLYSEESFDKLFNKFSKTTKSINLYEFLRYVGYHFVGGYYLSNEFKDFTDYILNNNNEGDVIKYDSSISSPSYQNCFIQLINNFSLFKLNDLEYINTTISTRLKRRELLSIKKELEDEIKLYDFVSLFRFVKMNPKVTNIINSFGFTSFVEFLELIPSIAINKDFFGGVLITPIKVRYTNGGIIVKIFWLMNKQCVNVFDFSELILKQYGFKISGEKLLYFLKNQNLFVFGDYVAVDKESYLRMLNYVCER